MGLKIPLISCERDAFFPVRLKNLGRGSASLGCDLVAPVLFGYVQKYAKGQRLGHVQSMSRTHLEHVLEMFSFCCVRRKTLDKPLRTYPNLNDLLVLQCKQ